jgi:hypothetical protein
VLDPSSPAGGRASLTIGALASGGDGDRSSDRLQEAFAGNAAGGGDSACSRASRAGRAAR